MSKVALVWTIYLNDIDAAGETEFLYQKVRRVEPKENSCSIFPAGFTHMHRGNVVHGEKTKYILTGWFYYTSKTKLTNNGITKVNLSRQHASLRLQ